MLAGSWWIHNDKRDSSPGWDAGNHPLPPLGSRKRDQDPQGAARWYLESPPVCPRGEFREGRQHRGRDRGSQDGLRHLHDHPAIRE